MKTKSTIRLAFISLTQRGLRSALTVLGIVIGIAALISLVGISQGAIISIEEQLNSFGSDVLTITVSSITYTVDFSGSVSVSGAVNGEIFSSGTTIGSGSGTLSGNSGNGTWQISSPIQASGTWSASKQ